MCLRAETACSFLAGTVARLISRPIAIVLWLHGCAHGDEARRESNGLSAETTSGEYASAIALDFLRPLLYHAVRPSRTFARRARDTGRVYVRLLSPSISTNTVPAVDSSDRISPCRSASVAPTGVDEIELQLGESEGSTLTVLDSQFSFHDSTGGVTYDRLLSREVNACLFYDLLRLPTALISCSARRERVCDEAETECEWCNYQITFGYEMSNAPGDAGRCVRSCPRGDDPALVPEIQDQLDKLLAVERAYVAIVICSDLESCSTANAD